VRAGWRGGRIGCGQSVRRGLCAFAGGRATLLRRWFLGHPRHQWRAGGRRFDRPRPRGHKLTAASMPADARDRRLQSRHAPFSGVRVPPGGPLRLSLAHQYDQDPHLPGGSGSMGGSGALSCTGSSRKPGSSRSSDPGRTTTRLSYHQPPAATRRHRPPPAATHRHPPPAPPPPPAPTATRRPAAGQTRHSTSSSRRLLLVSSMSSDPPPDRMVLVAYSVKPLISP
jgi:hypothetical protein